MSESTYNKKAIAAAVAGVTALVVGVTYFGLDMLGTAAATDTRAEAVKVGEPTQSNIKVVATVDGAEITEAELLPFLNAGMDKAVAVDRAINKVVAANNADKLYKQVSKSAMQSAKNDILANVFVNERSQEVRKSVTDGDVKAFYDERVKVEDFTSFRLRFFVSVDPKEAQAVYDGVGRGEKEAMAQLTFVKKDGDHYLTAGEVPYGLGAAVKKLKAGERLQPVTIREGILVLYVDDVKANPKPDFAKVQAEIKDLIVAERFNADIKARRAAAKIELRS
ncbi:MAG: peptidylprolyl isomerase [Pseudomonadota bacterium]